MEKWKIEKEGKNNHSIYLATLKVYTKFEYSGCNRSWECCDNIFLFERKKKWTKKSLISSSTLILFYTIQQVISNICTKFQNLGAVVPEKSLKQTSLSNTLEWEMEKRQMKKYDKNKSQHLGFLSHNILVHPRGV